MSDQTNTQTVDINTNSSLADWLPALSDILPDSLLPSAQLIAEHSLATALMVSLLAYVIAATLRSLLLNVFKRLTGLTQSTVDDAVLQGLRKPIF